MYILFIKHMHIVQREFCPVVFECMLIINVHNVNVGTLNIYFFKVSKLKKMLQIAESPANSS